MLLRILQASIVVGIVALPQGSSGDESIRPILATPLDDVPASAYAQMATCPKQMPLPRRQPAVAPERFVLTRCHGGINQQRVQIAESAAAAYYLDATLIVPELLVHHWWNDSFRFEELFDEQYFVQQMRRIGVPTVTHRELPNGFVRGWYKECMRAPRTPDSGRISKVCARHRVSPTKKVSSFKKMAEMVVAKGWEEYGVVHLDVLDRLNRDIDPEPLEPALRFIQCFANYRALRPIAPVRSVVSFITKALPPDVVAVHLRQELDTLAISGCVSAGEPRYAEAEAVIAAWGGWGAAPMRGATENLKKHGSAGELRRLGKCGVGPSQAVEVLKAAGFYGGAAADERGKRPATVYLAGGDEHQVRAFESFGYVVREKHALISQGVRASGQDPRPVLERLKRHASVGAFIDAEVAARAAVYLYAKGNFDRVVRGLRARRNLPSAATHLYFPCFERGDLEEKVAKHLRMRADSEVRDGAKEIAVYHNPGGTKPFMGCYCLKVDVW